MSFGSAPCVVRGGLGDLRVGRRGGLWCAAVEEAYAAHGAPTSVELAQLGEPDLAALLTDRGYRLEGFENVLGLGLAAAHDLPVPVGIEVRRSGDEFEAWLRVVVEASVHPDTQGVPWHDEFPAVAEGIAQRGTCGRRSS